MYNQVKDGRAQDSGFFFLCNHLCLAYLMNQLDKVKENLSPLPLSQAASGKAKSKLYE